MTDDIELRDAVAFVDRYPNAEPGALEAHLAECRVRRWRARVEAIAYSACKEVLPGR